MELNESIQAENVEQTDQFVVFSLASEKYATPILTVQEIIPSGEITPVPSAPAHVLGITNIRGEVATIISLSLLFNLPQAESHTGGYIILVKTERALFGVQVDQVTSVMNFNNEALRPAENLENSSVDHQYIQNVLVDGEDVILVLDLYKVVDQHGEHNSEPTHN
jgi:purine-binding chemotaxis protein CheW